MVLEAFEKSGNDTPTATDMPKRHDDDLPPELCHYRDEGCAYAASCLNCPYPTCLDELPRGGQRLRRRRRERDMTRLAKKGWRNGELAVLFGVSERTVQRVLKNNVAAAAGN